MDQNKVESSSSANSGSKEQASLLRRPTLTKIGSYAAPKISQDNRPDSSSRSSTSSRDHGTILTADTEQFIIGQKVWVGGTSPGQIAYIGETHFAPGEWAGIVLDEPNGKNDGCVAGKRYFQCEAKKGIFSRLTRLTLQPLEGAVAKSALKYSPDRSRTVSPTPSTQSVLNKSMGGRHGFKIGDRVIVSSGFGSRPGTLRFLGETQFSSGNWCGIELDDATGKNDGSVEGVKYFECKPKYGIFVPVAKVSLSPSSAKSRLSRAGSRESLTSVGTMNSIATTNTSRLRMQRYSNSMKQPPPSASKSSFSMQDLLREKQNHIEQLMIERDMEQEDAQNQALQFQKIILELKSKIDSLEKKLDDEKNKTEDLQLSIEEANFCGDELNAQTQVYKEKISDLEQRLRAVTSGAENLLPPIIPGNNEIVSNTEITSSTESKKDIQQKNNQYSLNQSEKSKLDNLQRTEALNAFRSLLSMKDTKQSDTTYQEQLNLYIKNADEIRRVHSIETPLDQMSDTFLKDLCESLALAIKELSLMSLETKNALKINKDEIERLENEKIHILDKNLEDLTINCNNLSGLNEQLQKENQISKEKIQQFENEKQKLSTELQAITSNCESLAGLNEQLKKELGLNKENTKQLEQEKLNILQKLEHVLSNCKSLSGINAKMQEESKTFEGEADEDKASRHLEDILNNCKRLSELNDKLTEDLKTNEERLEVMDADKTQISQKLQEAASNCKRHTEIIDELQQKLVTSEEKSGQLQSKDQNVSKNLEEITVKCNSLSEFNEKLKEELKTIQEKSSLLEAEKLTTFQQLEKSEEKLKEIEKEKFDIAIELNDFKTKYESLAKQTEVISQDLKISEEKSKLLETEKCDVSQKLEDVQSTLKRTLEQYENLQQQLKTNEEKSSALEAEKLTVFQKLEKSEEKLKEIEKEKFDISIQLNDFKTRYESLSKQTESLSQDLKISEEKSKSLETEKFDISQKLEDVQFTLKKTLEQNENLQQQLKTNEENSNLLEKEKFELSRKLKENTTNYNSLTEQNNKLQQDLKANEEDRKKLEETNLDISLKLKDAISNYESLSEIKNKLQEELLSKNEGNDSFCNNLLQQIEKLQLETKSTEESNKQLECEKFNLSQKIEKITLSVTSLTESNENVLQELQAANKKYELLETENFDLSRKLEDDSHKYISLLKIKDELQGELNSDREKTKQLEENTFKISRELDEVSSKYKNISEENVKLQQKLEALAESITDFEVQKFELTQKLEKITSNCDESSEQNTQLQRKLLETEEKLQQLVEEKLNISRKFEEVNLKNESLSEISNKLEQKLSAIENNSKQLDSEKGDISGKLDSVTIHCKNLEEVNEKLQKELNAINDQIKEKEVEKNNISQKLNDMTTSYTDLTELKDKLQNELEKNENKNKELATEKLEISANLIDATLQIANLSELSENLQQKFNSTEEQLRAIEREKLEISHKYEELLESNKNLQKDRTVLEEKASILKAEHLDISGNLIDATLQCENLSREKDILEQKLKETEAKLNRLTEKSEKTAVELSSAQSEIEEKARMLKAENLEISGNLVDATLQCENLSREKEILEQKLKETEEKLNSLTEKSEKTADELSSAQSDIEEKARILKAENLEISGNLIDATLQCENLSREKEILELKLKETEEKLNSLTEKSVKTADEMISVQAKSQNLKAEIPQDFPTKNISSIVALIQSVKAELETEYFREALTKNDNLKRFIQNISKIETELNTNQSLSQDLANASFDSNTQEVLLLEKRKAHQNVHNEFITGRLHLGNQLQDIYQFLISIKSQMENLDNDIQKIPSQTKLRTEMLNAAEEKSCKLHFDFIDLAQRFEALVKINEKYPSLRSSISKFILDEAKQNIKKQEAYSEFDPSDQIELLQNIIISYKLVLKANDVEIASNLLVKSDLELLPSEKHSEQKRILQNLQNDLEDIRSFIDKLEELNFLLKSLRFFQSKLSKYNAQVNENFNYLKNDKDSLEDICKVTLMLRDAEKQLQTECSGVTKILVNSMESFETSRKSLDRSKTEKNQFTAPMSHIDKSITTINSVMDSNSELLNLLSEKIETIDDNITKSSINHHHQNLEGNTEVKLKSENMDGTAAQINFLHSIIADMQQKNDKLKDKIETLEAFSVDSQKSNMYEMITKRKPAPRMFCDICDQFDLHETEDCPLQESDGGEASFQSVEVESENNNLSSSSSTRKYCEHCEAFGDHETEDCYAGLE